MSEYNSDHREPSVSSEGHVHGNHRTTLRTMLFELTEHIPFSVAAVSMGLLVAGAICILGYSGMEGFDPGVAEQHAGHDHGDNNPARLFFHLFHPAHMLFSAAATAAMFYRYDRRALKAIFIGLIGAIGVCGISDVIIPHLSLMILNVPTKWHICVIEHPDLVIPFAIVGVLMGITASAGVMRSTMVSHSLHVLMSTMASIFYMVGPLGVIAWIDQIGKVFVFVILAVVVPCCASDIVFPLFMSHAGRKEYAKEPHCH